MHNGIKPDSWIWVVVQDPGGNEQFLGSQNKEDNVSFIPAFFEKEEAQQCLPHIPHQKGKKYEVQAIFFEELAKDALKSGFMIFMLNASGEILQKIKP